MSARWAIWGHIGLLFIFFVPHFHLCIYPCKGNFTTFCRTILCTNWHTRGVCLTLPTFLSHKPSMKALFECYGQLTYVFDIWPWRVTLTLTNVRFHEMHMHAYCLNISLCLSRFNSYVYLTPDIEGWHSHWHVTPQNVRLKEIHMHANYRLCLYWFKSYGYLTLNVNDGIDLDLSTLNMCSSIRYTSMLNIKYMYISLLDQKLWPNIDHIMWPLKMCGFIGYTCTLNIKCISLLDQTLWICWPLIRRTTLTLTCHQNVQLHKIHMHAKYQVYFSTGSEVMTKTLTI